MNKIGAANLWERFLKQCWNGNQRSKELRQVSYSVGNKDYSSSSLTYLESLVPNEKK